VEGQRPSRTVMPRAVVRADREAYLWWRIRRRLTRRRPLTDIMFGSCALCVTGRMHDENQWPAAEGEGVSSLSRGGHGVRSSPSCEVRRPQGSGSALSKLDCLES
jgi:hypothetical protein